MNVYILLNSNIDIMKFNIFGKKFKCDACGKKFKTETELMTHNQAEHKV
jgi:hypothetical protein